MRTAPIGPSNGMPADHQRRRGGVDRQHVVRVLLVGAEDGRDDLGLVAEAVGERRAQRAVGEAAGEDGVLGRTAFTAEERAGDLAGGVRPLLDVDRQREEVDARTDVVGGVGGGQDRRAADGGDDGALALRGQLAGLEGRASCRSRRRDRTRGWGQPRRAPFAPDDSSGRSSVERPAGSQSAIPPIPARVRSRNGRPATEPRPLGFPPGYRSVGPARRSATSPADGDRSAPTQWRDRSACAACSASRSVSGAGRAWR